VFHGICFGPTVHHRHRYKAAVGHTCRMHACLIVWACLDLLVHHMVCLASEERLAYESVYVVVPCLTIVTYDQVLPKCNPGWQCHRLAVP
jgi:hypothetical protein